MRTRSQARNRNRRQQQLTTVIVEEPEFPMADNLTSTFRHPEVPNTSIKLLLFPFSLDGEARDWLDKEPPRSILTWDDLVSKFINQFFPPSKTTYLRNEITTFYQKPNETFNEAWERFKGLLRQCPHHGFSELHQLDTFYNSLNTNDQDALDSAAGGNFLDKMPRDGLAIIESKSKVRYSRSRPNDSRAITNAPSSTSSPSNNSFEIQQMAALLEDKMNIRMSRLEKAISEKNATTPATVKAVEEVCVTCGSNHNFNNCPLTRNDFPVFHDNIHQFQQTPAVQLEGPSTPLVPTPDISIPSKEPKQNPETSTEKVQNPNLENTAHVPPPEEEDSIFIEIPKPKAKKTVNVEIQDLNSPRPNSILQDVSKQQLRLEIGLKDALVEMPKFNKWLSSLLRNKEKLEEIAIMTVNAECSAIIMNKVPEKLEDPGKFLIPCALQELNRTSALADSGASINLLPHSIYKKLGLEALTPTRMTLELANRSITHTNRCIARDVFADELASLDSLPPGNDDSTLKEDLHKENFQVYSTPLFEFDDNFKSSTINPLFDEIEEDVEIINSNVSDEPVFNTPLSDKVECFAPEDNDDEIDVFLAMEVSSNFEEGYFDSEGDVIFLDNLLITGIVHTNQSSVIESLPVSPILIEVNESPNLDHQDDPSIPRPPPEPPILRNVLNPKRGEGMGRHPYSVPGFCLGGKDGVWGGIDISKITRKPSKTGKHGHENGRACKSRKPKSEKSTMVKLQSKKVKPWSNRKWNGIRVNAGDSKVMLLGINLLLLGKVNAARHNLLLLVVKTVNREPQLQAPKTTAWNEFSSTMASAIICLATNQKFNFSKYIFESMVKNLDNAGKFLMFPRFMKVFLDKQLKVMQSHKRIYDAPSHTKKIFGNMKRVVKGFSGRETPLFPAMDSGNINKTQSKATPNEPSSPGTSSGGGPRRQETMGDTIAQTRFKHVSKLSNDPLFTREHKDCSSTGNYKFETESQEVREERMVKNSQAQKIIQEQEVLDSKKDDVVSTAVDAAQVSTATTTVTISLEEITLAQALQDLKAAKPKVKWVVFKEPVESTTTISSQQPSHAKIQDKGKAKMIEPRPVKKLSNKDQLKLDEEVAQRLQAEFDEQERIKREKAKANIALKETWDDIHAKIEADCLLAERLQTREQEELTIEKRAKLFQQLLKKRRKHFAAKRAEEKRNIPPTRAQQRSIMCTYLKNMAGWKPKDLKNKSFANIEELFDKAMKRVNIFVDFRTKLVEDKDKEIAELQSLMEVIPDKEEVAVDAIPFANKPLSIVDWKIHKEGKKSYYQIIRADGRSKMYLVFSHMLKSFDKEDLETLYKLVKAKYVSTRLVEDLDLVLYGDLKTMFNPHVEDQGWIVRIKRLLDDLRVTAAKVYVTTASINTARVKLVLLEKIEENILSSYYCLYTVNAAGV
ncbi:reverse transcriptase domain-containing protein [Tanacetum coccineum]